MLNWSFPLGQSIWKFRHVSTFIFLKKNRSCSNLKQTWRNSQTIPHPWTRTWFFTCMHFKLLFYVFLLKHFLMLHLIAQFSLPWRRVPVQGWNLHPRKPEMQPSLWLSRRNRRVGLLWTISSAASTMPTGWIPLQHWRVHQREPKVRSSCRLSRWKRWKWLP